LEFNRKLETVKDKLAAFQTEISSKLEKTDTRAKEVWDTVKDMRKNLLCPGVIGPNWEFKTVGEWMKHATDFQKDFANQTNMLADERIHRFAETELQEKLKETENDFRMMMNSAHMKIEEV
jgi:hypothetical protein